MMHLKQLLRSWHYLFLVCYQCLFAVAVAAAILKKKSVRKHIKTHTTINHNKIDCNNRFDCVDVNDNNAFETIVAIMVLPFLSVVVVVVVVVIVVMIVDDVVVVDAVAD